MKPRLTLYKIKTAALKAFKQGTLVAQMDKPLSNMLLVQDYKYKNYTCAIGAAISKKKLLKIYDEQTRITDEFSISPDEMPAIMAIIQAHDNWAARRTDEKPFISLLT